ncbi:hypothetical protein BBJ28_00006058 [Nothophytophthora sp. Chile5]|nr:hypothetical protein BBJ28_00006058 [Nothophytophthora sp. Chile5]
MDVEHNSGHSGVPAPSEDPKRVARRRQGLAVDDDARTESSEGSGRPGDDAEFRYAAGADSEDEFVDAVALPTPPSSTHGYMDAVEATARQIAVAVETTTSSGTQEWLEKHDEVHRQVAMERASLSQSEGDSSAKDEAQEVEEEPEPAPEPESDAVQEVTIEEVAVEEAVADEPVADAVAVEEVAVEEAVAAVEEVAVEEAVVADEPVAEAAEEVSMEDASAPEAESDAVEAVAVEEAVADEPVADAVAVEEVAVEEAVAAVEEVAVEEAVVADEPVAEAAEEVSMEDASAPEAESDAVEAVAVEEAVAAVEEVAVEEAVATVEEVAVEEAVVADEPVAEAAEEVSMEDASYAETARVVETADFTGSASQVVITLAPVAPSGDDEWTAVEGQVASDDTEDGTAASFSTYEFVEVPPTPALPSLTPAPAIPSSASATTAPDVQRWTYQIFGFTIENRVVMYHIHKTDRRTGLREPPILKRYSDFRELETQLRDTGLAPVADMPRVPKATVTAFLRGRKSKRTIEVREKAFKAILQYITQHPVLHNGVTFQRFVETSQSGS